MLTTPDVSGPTDEPGHETAPEPARSRRRFDLRLAVASMVIASGLALIGFGLVRSVTGDDVTKLPAAIESISPVPDAVQVPAQTDIFVDLASGYSGRLEIDGVAFDTVNVDMLRSADIEPGAQIEVPPGVVVYEPGNATLRFTPAADTAIERFGEGNHTVQVIYWTIELGPDHAHSYPWTFHVV